MTFPLNPYDGQTITVGSTIFVWDADDSRWRRAGSGEDPGPDPGSLPAIYDAIAFKAPIDSPHFTGTVQGVTQAMVGLPNVDNTPDASKPVSTPQRAAIDTVGNALTALAASLDQVDNTADAAKPVSGPQQEALDGKVSGWNGEAAETLSLGFDGPGYTNVWLWGSNLEDDDGGTYLATRDELTDGLAGKLDKSGGEVTGDLTVRHATFPKIALMKTTAGGGSNELAGYQGLTRRWGLRLGDGDDTGSANGGNNFSIFRYSDAGAYLTTPFTINRGTGEFTFQGGVVTIRRDGQEPVLILNNTSAALANAIEGHQIGIRLWRIEMPTGSGSSGNFLIGRWSGNTFLDAPIQIVRSSGGVTMPNNLQVDGRVYAARYMDRQGESGSFGGHSHNFYWTGSALQVWVDATNLGNMSYTSDERVKKQVRQLGADALRQSIAEIRPITFHYRQVGIFRDDGQRRIGFSAQNLLTALPEAVVGDVDAVAEDGTPVPASVDTTPIVAGLVLEAQAQAREIVALATRLAALEGRIHQEEHDDA